MKNTYLELLRVLDGIEKKYSNDPASSIIAGAYALWLARTLNQMDIEKISDFLYEREKNETIRLFILSKLESHWDEYRRYITAFSANDLENFILTYKFENVKTPIVGVSEKLNQLFAKLLDVKNTDSIADMGVGVGDFLKTVHSICPEAQLWGNDISTTAIAIVLIKSKFLDGKLTIVQEDMFASKEHIIFDKIHCFPPWSMKLGVMPSARDFITTLPPTVPVLKGTGATEWIFALRMLSSLKENGKATMLMPNGGTFNLLDTAIRKYFVERGMIEAVIALPARLLDFTPIPSTIIVFSNKNTHIKMVDATQLGSKGRRNVELTDQDIEKILNATLNNDEEISKFVSNEEILKNDSVLNPGRYVRKEIVLKNSVPFGNVIKSIIRGANLTSKDFDELSSKESTEFQYLMLSNINDGMIDEDLPYLKGIDSRLARFCLQPNDLIFSKIGSPFKIAIATERPQKIVATGNLFIIRLDETLADPYYIKAFLESEIGMNILSTAAVGAAVANLSTEAIKNINIDLPSLDKQKEIANRYKAKLSEINYLRKKLSQAIDSLSQIITEE